MSSIFPISTPSGEEWVLISKTVVNVSAIEFGGVSRYVPFVNENTLTSGSMFSFYTFPLVVMRRTCLTMTDWKSFPNDLMILMNDSVVLLLGGIKHKYKMVTKFKKGVKQKY